MPFCSARATKTLGGTAPTPGQFQRASNSALIMR